MQSLLLHCPSPNLIIRAGAQGHTEGKREDKVKNLLEGSAGDQQFRVERQQLERQSWRNPEFSAGHAELSCSGLF